jgi:hypothetical protein
MLRKIMTAVATGAMLAGFGLATSSTAQAAPAYPKVYLHSVTDQWTHWTPDANASSHAGELYAGDNYYYCLVNGDYYLSPVTGYGNYIWLRTDDDSGNRDVYVSSTNLTLADLQRVLQVLPNC